MAVSLTPAEGDQNTYIRFREHVFRDLRPYICTHTECDSGNQLYDSWKDWATHERWTHNKIWECSEHPTSSYDSISQFKEHLREDHDWSLSESDVNRLVSISGKVSETAIRDCPFCLCSLEDSQSLQNHIATHLQRIALFALPRSTKVGDDSQESDSSSRANAIGQGSQQLSSHEELSERSDQNEDNESSADLRGHVDIEQSEGTSDQVEGSIVRALNLINKEREENKIDESSGDVKSRFKTKLGHNIPTEVKLQTALVKGDISAVKSLLAGLERNQGEEHPLTLEAIRILGLLYKDQACWNKERLAQADAMCTRALTGIERVLGKEHPSIIKTVGILSLIYLDQIRLIEAEAMCKRTLALRETTLRPEHPDTLSSVNNLGLCYQYQCKMAEAESMHTRALAGMEKILGPEYFDTLRYLSNLGLCYQEQGRLAEAEAMYTRALAGKKKVLGEEHPSTICTIDRLESLNKFQYSGPTGLEIMRGSVKYIIEGVDSSELTS